VAALQAPDPPFGATGKVRQLALREAAQAPEPPDAQAKLACVHLRSSVASSLISARGARRQSQVISGNDLRETARQPVCHIFRQTRALRFWRRGLAMTD